MGDMWKMRRLAEQRKKDEVRDGGGGKDGGTGLGVEVVEDGEYRSPRREQPPSNETYSPARCTEHLFRSSNQHADGQWIFDSLGGGDEEDALLASDSEGMEKMEKVIVECEKYLKNGMDRLLKRNSRLNSRLQELFVEARLKVDKLAAENEILSSKLHHANSSLECPSCKTVLSTTRNLIRPKYVKVMRGRFVAELTFADLSTMKRWLMLNHLDTDVEGVPVFFSEDIEEPANPKEPTPPQEPIVPTKKKVKKSVCETGNGEEVEAEAGEAVMPADSGKDPIAVGSYLREDTPTSFPFEQTPPTSERRSRETRESSLTARGSSPRLPDDATKGEGRPSSSLEAVVKVKSRSVAPKLKRKAVTDYDGRNEKVVTESEEDRRRRGIDRFYAHRGEGTMFDRKYVRIPLRGRQLDYSHRSCSTYIRSQSHRLRYRDARDLKQNYH